MAGKYEEWMVSEWNRVKRWRECEWQSLNVYGAWTGCVGMVSRCCHTVLAFTAPFSLCTLMVCCTDSPALDHYFVHFPRGARWGRLAITCVEDVDYLERKVEVMGGREGWGVGVEEKGRGGEWEGRERWRVGGKGGVRSGRKVRGVKFEGCLAGVICVYVCDTCFRGELG